MAREITVVTTLTADVRFDGPAHIGGSATLTGEAAPLVRDVAGRPIVPGTSLAGALRAALGPLGVDPAVWGTEEDGGGASRVTVRDAVVDLGDAVPGERDGVAIDRRFGSAADARLYAREVIPEGATARLTVEIESVAGTEVADRALLAAVRAVLKSDGLVIGARSSRGYGRIALRRPATVTARRYDTPDGFWSTRRAPAPVVLPAAALPAADVVEIDIEWSAATPVIVAAGGLSAETPQVPIMEPDPAAPGRLRQVVPGTSIAGALRSRAELICRTVARTPTPEGIDAQIASTPLVTALFGGPAGAAGATASPLTVRDCASTTTVLATEWVKMVQPDPVRRVTAKGGAEVLLTDHVAVDRWTGGAADGLLFAVAEPHGFRYEPIRLRLDRSRLPDDVRDAATALLLVTVREFVEQRVPLGGGTHRGLGAVTVQRVHVRGAGLDADADRLDLTTDRIRPLRTAWQNWIAAA